MDSASRKPVDDVLEKLTTYRRKRNRAVVLGLRPVTFLEDRDYVGKAPVLWDSALVQGSLEENGENVRKFRGENFE